eukprot:10511392-Ditylum_brightwellii.AAC.1
MKLWTKTRTLPKPIERWMVPSNQLYCVWLAYYEFSNGYLYVKQYNRYVQYNPDKSGKDSNWTLTDTSVPAHIRMTDGMVTIEEVDCSGVVSNVQVQQDDTFQMHLDFLEVWESSLLQNVNTVHPIHKIFDTISEESFIITTDGSSGDMLMSFGWKTSDREGKAL